MASSFFNLNNCNLAAWISWNGTFQWLLRTWLVSRILCLCRGTIHVLAAPLGLRMQSTYFYLSISPFSLLSPPSPPPFPFLGITCKKVTLTAGILAIPIMNTINTKKKKMSLWWMNASSANLHSHVFSSLGHLYVIPKEWWELERFIASLKLSEFNREKKAPPPRSTQFYLKFLCLQFKKISTPKQGLEKMLKRR